MSAGNFFAGAKKSPRNTFSGVEGVFAECPSLAMQRTAHILCALAGFAAEKKSVSFAAHFLPPHVIPAKAEIQRLFLFLATRAQNEELDSGLTSSAVVKLFAGMTSR